MISGTAYGVILNDQRQRERLGSALEEAPYKKPPVAPVLYIKPRNCFASSGSTVAVPAGLDAVEVAATLGLLFRRDLSAGDPPPGSAIGSACLAVDVSEPTASFYRPMLIERCRDGFLPLGGQGLVPQNVSGLELSTSIDGQIVHRWTLDSLVRNVPLLLRDVSDFMTLSAGDLLLIGLPGDAPVARAGQRVTVEAGGLPTLSFGLQEESLQGAAA